MPAISSVRALDAQGAGISCRATRTGLTRPTMLFLLLCCLASFAMAFPQFYGAIGIGAMANPVGTNSIAHDSQGNVYITGNLRGTVDFDPSSGVYELTAEGGFGAFVAKYSSAGDLLWAYQFGNAGSTMEVGQDVAVDSNDNVVIVGRCNGTAEIDHAGGTYTLQTATYGTFIVKLDANGYLCWASQKGRAIEMVNGQPVVRTCDAYSYAIAIDENDNVYCTGSLSGRDQAYTGGPFVTRSTVDTFVTKYSAVDGSCLWTEYMGSTGSTKDSGLDIAIDNVAGAAYVTGYFETGGGTASFGPYTLQSVWRYSDIFITRHDVSTGGVQWARRAGGGDDSLGYIYGDEGKGIAVDSQGNIFVTGIFYQKQNAADFGATTLTSAGGYDIFITKLNASGDFLWAKGIGATGDQKVWGLARDTSDNIYLAGLFRGAVDFDPDPLTTYTMSEANGRTYITKLTTDGNFLWACQLGKSLPPNSAYGGISVGADGMIYTTGAYTNPTTPPTADFDPGTGTYLLPSIGTYDDIFVSWLTQP